MRIWEVFTSHEPQGKVTLTIPLMGGTVRLTGAFLYCQTLEIMLVHQRVILPPPIATRDITCATWSHRRYFKHPSRFQLFCTSRISARVDDGCGNIASPTTDCRINNTAAITPRPLGRPIICHVLPFSSCASPCQHCCLPVQRSGNFHDHARPSFRCISRILPVPRPRTAPS